jgi:phosphatidylglycerophosphatase C
VRFVERLARQGMHRDALDAIASHRAAGDRLVLMSASPELYVPAIAAHLGFTDTICTRVRWNAEHLHGELTTPNCRFREKAERLKEWRGRFPGIRTVAYANAASDLPHLEIADEGVLVNGRAPTRLIAEKLGIRCVDWQ